MFVRCAARMGQVVRHQCLLRLIQEAVSFRLKYSPHSLAVHMGEVVLVMQAVQVRGWVVDFLPRGGDKEKLITILVIPFIPLAFPFGNKVLWSHSCVVSFEPLLLLPRQGNSGHKLCCRLVVLYINDGMICFLCPPKPFTDL